MIRCNLEYFRAIAANFSREYIRASTPANHRIPIWQSLRRSPEQRVDTGLRVTPYKLCCHILFVQLVLGNAGRVAPRWHNRPAILPIIKEQDVAVGEPFRRVLAAQI